MPTVPIIDGEVKAREVCHGMTEPDGFGVREAADGQEGLAACLVEPADVVLCDPFMPERGGRSGASEEGRGK